MSATVLGSFLFRSLYLFPHSLCLIPNNDYQSLITDYARNVVLISIRIEVLTVYLFISVKMHHKQREDFDHLNCFHTIPAQFENGEKCDGSKFRTGVHTITAQCENDRNFNSNKSVQFLQEFDTQEIYLHKSCLASV